jgi:hypothetical protein
MECAARRRPAVAVSAVRLLARRMSASVTLGEMPSLQRSLVRHAPARARRHAAAAVPIELVALCTRGSACRGFLPRGLFNTCPPVGFDHGVAGHSDRSDPLRTRHSGCHRTTAGSGNKATHSVRSRRTDAPGSRPGRLPRRFTSRASSLSVRQTTTDRHFAAASTPPAPCTRVQISCNVTYAS